MSEALKELDRFDEAAKAWGCLDDPGSKYDYREGARREYDDAKTALISLVRKERSAREKAERERDEARAAVADSLATARIAVEKLSSIEAGTVRMTELALSAESELARLRGELAGGWRVKPLVWRKSNIIGWNGDYHTVPTSYSIRCADENGWKWSSAAGFGYAASPEAAKAAAQADYEARIRAAIEPATQEPAHD